MLWSLPNFAGMKIWVLRYCGIAVLRGALTMKYNTDFEGIEINDRIDMSQQNFLGKSKELGLREGEAFNRATKAALAKINTRPIGRELLNLISKRTLGIGTKISEEKKVTIYYGTGTYVPGNVDPVFALHENTFAKADTGLRDRKQLRSDNAMSVGVFQGSGKAEHVKPSGRGTSANISYNPFINATGVHSRWVWDMSTDGNPVVSKSMGKKLQVTIPAFIALAHELIHAFHFLTGDASPVRLQEEARTVGIGRFKNARISENAIRGEHGLMKRTFYSRPGDCG